MGVVPLQCVLVGLWVAALGGVVEGGRSLRLGLPMSLVLLDFGRNGIFPGFTSLSLICTKLCLAWKFFVGFRIVQWDFVALKRYVKCHILKHREPRSLETPYPTSPEDLGMLIHISASYCSGDIKT